MKFDKGHQKLGGRKAGTPNKASLKLLDQLIAKELNPVDEIIKLLEQVGPNKKLDVWMKLLSYCYPTLKAIELSGNSEEPITVTESNVAMLWQIARSQALSAVKEKETG